VHLQTADSANVARVFNSVGDFYGVLIARVARAARNLFSPRPWSVRMFSLSLSACPTLGRNSCSPTRTKYCYFQLHAAVADLLS